MIENIKTFILWVLIITSVLFTWQIWTYQHDYNFINETEYYESEQIGEERSLEELIQPKQVITHEEDNSFWIQPTNNHYLLLMEELKQVNIQEIRRGSNSFARTINDVQGIELLFSHEIKGEWIHRFFEMDQEEPFPMEGLDRIIIFINEQSSETEVSVRFMSTSEDVLYQANTNLSATSLISLYEQYEDTHKTLVEERSLLGSAGGLYTVNYMPVEEVEANKYFYTATELSIEAFKNGLFNDPEFVKQYSLGNDEVFADGIRMMSVENDGYLLKYGQTSQSLQPGAGERSIVDASIDFINGHAGWTGNYQLDQWRDSLINDRVTYRLHVKGLPTLSTNFSNQDILTFNITRQGSQISEYVRPLFHFENEDLFDGHYDTVTLPSYDDLISIIEQKEILETSNIEDARIGYYMRIATYVFFEPSWFVKERGSSSWRRIDTSEQAQSRSQARESDDSGLE
ncbi:YycH family regulatory protein [Evansella cellulosilytica]|uniref:YycH family protein n=1 Tax=Evansella cellulosilytica (strain ATCC 21833 / DSM 2522 / FERM P-1141 / JCM 9156 / N-4) TaxID=649639 RepID=E6TZW5_EVAC2|nr:two-component system activity regulator YycH [Evansella cellulosilytica]ADU32531.1 YycH family protein [Evansella cellulosilytica DSM 2522]